MKTNLVINNFSRGQLDHDLNGRFELPFYTNGFEVCRNIISNYKGNAKNRPGFIYISKTKNNNPARLMPFRFNTEQSYLLEWTDNYLRFYSYDKDGNFGYVIADDKSIVELKTDITFNQVQKLQRAQNADVMRLTMNQIAPKELKRTAANVFTIGNATVTGLDFTALGYPAAVTFAEGRLWYGGFEKKPTSANASKVTEYNNFTIPASPKDDDALKFTISEITDPIEWIFGGQNNVYAGNPEGITIINGGDYNTPITSTSVDAGLSNNEGASGAIPTIKDSLLFYVSNDKSRIYAFDYDLMTEKFIASDLNLLSSEVTKGKIKEIVFKKDDNNLIYMLLENGKLLALLYNKTENIMGWYPIETDGFIESITTLTRPDGKDDLFIAVNRGGVRSIEVLADEVKFTNFYESPHFLTDKDKSAYNRLIAEELKSCVYLDNASVIDNIQNNLITLNGEIVTAENDVFTTELINHNIVYQTKTGAEYGTMKILEVIDAKNAKVKVLSESVTPASWSNWYISFDVIGNMEDLNNKEVQVVIDGGYLGRFMVKDGKIKLDREASSCVVGLSYQSFFKSFNIGSMVEGVNLQTVKKNVARFILRFVNSGGCMVGTSLFDMLEVQEFNPSGFYDLPPLPLDGDYEVTNTDNTDKAKCVFFKQDLPLPLNLTMLQYEVDFRIKS